MLGGGASQPSLVRELRSKRSLVPQARRRRSRTKEGRDRRSHAKETIHGRCADLWTISLVVQARHFVEHRAWQIQAIVGTSMFGSRVPTSFVQTFVSRPELHLIYNAIVFIPMVVAMVLHTRPGKSVGAGCTCAS